MSTSLVIHLDDDEKVRKTCLHLASQMPWNIEYIQCSTKAEFDVLIKNRKDEVKCLIFDLLGTDPDKAQLNDGDMEFLGNIKSSFNDFNVPIFIFSGYIEQLSNHFLNDGTIFKVSKPDGIETIFEKIIAFEEAGFLNIFSKNGLIDEEIRRDINKAFRLQFTQNNQILDVIDQIKKVHKNNYVPRVQSVFRRVAVRSLMSGLLSPRADIDGKFEHETVNTIEHYVQRLSPYKFWTGDIFKNQNNDHVLILTPRCDIANDKFNSLLICPLKLGFEHKKPDKVSGALNGNLKISGYSRFLAPSPVFPGGEAQLSGYYFIEKDNFLASHEKVITLSDELINEILSRFSTLFLRTGITSWNEQETLAHIQAQND